MTTLITAAKETIGMIVVHYLFAKFHLSEEAECTVNCQ